MQVLAVVPGELPGESQAAQVLAGVQVQVARGESQAVQGLANVPGGAGGESPAVQVLAVVLEERAGKSGGAGFGQH